MAITNIIYQQKPTTAPSVVIYESDGTKTLTSYQSIIAVVKPCEYENGTIVNQIVELGPAWNLSATTTKHLNTFADNETSLYIHDYRKDINNPTLLRYDTLSNPIRKKVLEAFWKTNSKKDMKNAIDTQAIIMKEKVPA